ncbi:hypothetical protein N0V92_009121 [Colletotrichum tropicale]|nr:hypothetical protein N0V92_009121 [Colletotrichum tropicale]
MSSTKKLRVAVLGPKGQCGSCVVDELLSRGHSVVGLSRNPPRGAGSLHHKDGSSFADEPDFPYGAWYVLLN